MSWKKDFTGRKNRFFVFGLIVLFLFSVVGCSSNTPQENASNNSAPVQVKAMDKELEAYYVDNAWLKENLNNVIILDARTEKEYKKGHVPGALNVTWQSLSNMEPKQGEVGWGVVLPFDQLEKKIGDLGIDGSKRVVVYNDPAGLAEDGRVMWMLNLAGLDDVRMLFGGWPAWQKAGGEINQEVPVVTPVSFKITNPDNSLIATTEYIKTNKVNIKLVDARSPEEYKGETNHGEKAKGHIPGAIPLCFRDTYNDDGSIKTVAELKSMFEKAGLSPDDDIVTYCTVGIRSGYLAEVLRMCGYTKAKNYNASFSEWSGDPKNPVEK
ncbi:MAG: sulfurtransferase [Syntrophomonas sp.]